MAMAQVYEGEVVDNDGLDFIGGLNDFAGPDDSDMWGSHYPSIQVNSFVDRFEFPLKWWAGTEVEATYPLENLKHEYGKEAGFGLEEINVSVLGIAPELWELKIDKDTKIYAPKPDFSGDQKWVRRYRFFVYCQEAGDDNPAIITVAGHHGKYLYKSLELGRRRNLGIVKQITGGKRALPGYLFWVTLRISEDTVEVGTKIKKRINPTMAVTPDIVGMQKPELIGLLQDLYVGDERKDLFGGLYDEGQQWVADQESRTLALVAPAQQNAQIEAPQVEVLEGGALYIPDMSAGDMSVWKEVGLSVPGLFEDQGECYTAFNSLMRKKGLIGPTSPNQWEAWRTELLRLWDDKIAQDQEVTRELESRG